MTDRSRLYAILAVHAHIPPSEARKLPLSLLAEIIDLLNER